MALAVATLATFATGCASYSSTTTGPAPAKCQVSLSTSMPIVDASGGTGNVTVTTEQECAWSATADPGWIAVASSSAGQGSGRVDLRISANPDGVSRRGEVTVNGQRLDIDQAAAPCRFAISAHDATIAATGGTGSVTVSGTGQCSWAATSSAAWIAITGGSSGGGNGTVRYQAAANSGPTRTATLTIAGEVFSVTQLSEGMVVPPACTYAIDAATKTVAAAGGPLSATVTASGTCAWTATAGVSWLTIASGASGAGNGTVTIVALVNPGAARSGAITVAGQTITIAQAGSSCNYTLNPVSQSIAAGGGAGSVAISTASSCGWTAASNAVWITGVTPNGTGNGRVNFVVAANAGPARSGTMTIAGRIVTLTQASGCSFTLNPATGQTVAKTAGSYTVTIAASDSSCGWTASVDSASWLTITSPANGTGSGTVTFSVSINTSKERHDTLTIAQRTFTVTQLKGN